MTSMTSMQSAQPCHSAPPRAKWIWCLPPSMLPLLILCFVAPRPIACASAQGGVKTVGGCPLFPSDNIWNRDISALPPSSNSAAYVARIGAAGHLHPDFGAGLYNGGPIGIPYTVVSAQQ